MGSKLQLILSSRSYSCICILYLFRNKDATRRFSVFKLIHPFYLNTALLETTDFFNYFPVGLQKFGIVLYVLFWKGIYQFFILYIEIFSRCPLIWNSISKTESISGIFLVLPIDYSLYEKTIVGIFVYLFICNDKSKFSFLKAAQSNRNTFYLRTSHFCATC